MSSFTEVRKHHWNNLSKNTKHFLNCGKWYHRRLAEIYQFLVPQNQRVLEIGSGDGKLLASLKPSYGVGIDFSSEMVEKAKKVYPGLEFIQMDAHNLSSLEGEFDTIILSDLINDLWDVQLVFNQIRSLCTPRTRIVMNFYSHLWQIPLSIAQNFHLALPMLPQNWLTIDDVENLLFLTSLERIKASQEILFPFPLGGFANRILVKFWPFRIFALTNFIVARAKPEPCLEQASVSVIVPARNEEGNIKSIFERVPKMGRKTEIIFVEGHSNDKTYEKIEEEIRLHPQLPSILLRQSGIGKADAVRLGFEKASCDILMILDADLTVPPEDLKRFYEAIISGKGELINGVRLVYPMEKDAMRSLNLIGNKMFSEVFSWLLGQPIKDTLCGTKVLWRKDYDLLASNRSYFGDFDPFGDYDLILGSAKMNLKIVDLPIRYRDRTYGATNISRWRHGFQLLRMVIFAAKKIKFI